jgi:hypothetical protein
MDVVARPKETIALGRARLTIAFLTMLLGIIMGASVLLARSVGAQSSTPPDSAPPMRIHGGAVACAGCAEGVVAQGGFGSASNSILSSTPTGTAMPECGLMWRSVTSPNGGTTENFLKGVAAISANDVWAVGYDGARTLTMHYTNGEWTVVPSPNVGTSNNRLTGVAAPSANDVWVVGVYANYYYQTLTMHYTNGEWTVVPSPNPGIRNHSLSAVAAVSADDVWAVGAYQTNMGQEHLMMHYTNGEWMVVPTPHVGNRVPSLRGLAAVSADDVWAVGVTPRAVPTTER